MGDVALVQGDALTAFRCFQEAVEGHRLAYEWGKLAPAEVLPRTILALENGVRALANLYSEPIVLKEVVQGFLAPFIPLYQKEGVGRGNIRFGALLSGMVCSNNF